MKKYLIGAVAVAAASVTLGGAAHAATYILNVDGCSGANGCGSASYGNIYVSGETTGVLTVDIELNATTTIFQEAGSDPHEEVWFDTNTNSVTIGGLSDPFTANGAQAAGANQANGVSFGTWDYVLQHSHDGNPSSPSGGLHSLIFTITGPPTLALGSENVGGKNLFFVVDIAGFNATTGALVNTGRVGATLQAGIPEPASWALMILGFGGVGAILRSRRHPGLATV
jgi:hypothetical protein